MSWFFFVAQLLISLDCVVHDPLDLQTLIPDTSSFMGVFASPLVLTLCITNPTDLLLGTRASLLHHGHSYHIQHIWSHLCLFFLQWTHVMVLLLQKVILVSGHDLTAVIFSCCLFVGLSAFSFVKKVIQTHLVLCGKVNFKAIWHVLCRFLAVYWTHTVKSPKGITFFHQVVNYGWDKDL